MTTGVTTKKDVPSSCLVMITTVDDQQRINAASFGTCVRVCHDPVYIAFTVGSSKDTYANVLSTGEFVVNIPSFDRTILEKVRILGLTFPPGVNETVFPISFSGLLRKHSAKPPKLLHLGTNATYRAAARNRTAILGLGRPTLMREKQTSTSGNSSIMR